MKIKRYVLEVILKLSKKALKFIIQVLVTILIFFAFGSLMEMIGVYASIIGFLIGGIFLLALIIQIKDIFKIRGKGLFGIYWLKNYEVRDACRKFGFKDIPTEEEFKKRYKELANIYHPDKEGGSVKIMQDINKYAEMIAAGFNMEHQFLDKYRKEIEERESKKVKLLPLLKK